MDNTNKKAPFKRIRVLGKSNPYLTTNKKKIKRLKLKTPLRAVFVIHQNIYILWRNIYIKKSDNVDKEKTIEPTKVFEHRKSLNLFVSSH